MAGTRAGIIFHGSVGQALHALLRVQPDPGSSHRKVRLLRAPILQERTSTPGYAFLPQYAGGLPGAIRRCYVKLVERWPRETGIVER